MSTEHPAPASASGRSRRLAGRAAAAGLAAGLTLSGCSLTTLTSMSPDLPRRPEPTAATTSAPPAAAVPVTVPVAAPPAARLRGDLAAGSLVRRLDAGKRTLVATYWTEQYPDGWTADRPTVVRVSAHLEDAGGRHQVKVTRFLATLDDGTAVRTLADDRGEFVLTPPYSYGSALSVVSSDPAAPDARLQVQLDLLVETIPGTGAFFRQTVLDTVALDFVPRPQAATPTTQESDHR